jgi:hypothetical protein
MIPDGVALIAHDLKNALGWLESDLARLSEQPTRALAQDAHAHCINLQRRFVHFLTLYGAADGLATHCEDESPLNLLENLQAHPLLPASTPQLRVDIGPCEDVPLYWYFDHRHVHQASRTTGLAWAAWASPTMSPDMPRGWARPCARPWPRLIAAARARATSTWGRANRAAHASSFTCLDRLP